MNHLIQGLNANITYRVKPEDLASAWKNEFPVLATPILLWLSELACMKTVAQYLDAEQITLGLAHNSRHIGASLEGAEISISAILSACTERTLEFSVTAHDQSRLIFEGTHSRALLTRDRFESKLEALRGDA